MVVPPTAAAARRSSPAQWRPAATADPSLALQAVTAPPPEAASDTTWAGDGVTVQATVNDANGNPLSGAAITWTASSGWTIVRQTTVTTPAGTAWATAMPTGSTPVPGTVTATLTDGTTARQAVAVQPLPAGSPTITGQVVDAQGHGLPGITVAFGGTGNTPNPNPVTTGANGTFVVPVTAGSYFLTGVTDPTRATEWVPSGTTTVTVGTAPVTVAPLPLQPALTFSGVAGFRNRWLSPSVAAAGGGVGDGRPGRG